jgi:predicted Zn-dependent protease
MGIYNLIFAKTMSRKEELEADTYGVKFASHCGFNANKGAKFFSKANSNFLERILSTHPSDE